MKRNLLALTLVAPLMLGTVACGAWFTVDGYDAQYVERPAGWEGGRRWRHHGVDVYEVNGRYYRQHEGRWVVYRERPRELVEFNVQVR